VPAMLSSFQSSSGHSDKAVRFAGGILVLLTFITYWNSLRVPFFFDDPVAILANPTIRNLSDIRQVLSPPRNGGGVTGRPLVNLSFAINYALGGTKVTGYHLANILFHASAGLLLFGCVRRTLAASSVLERFRPLALPVAFSITALWLAHPLQTESVTFVIQRTELLVGIFYLLTLYCFIRTIERPAPGWRAAAVASCLFGMATKEVMVTAPLLVLLYDRTFAAGSFAVAWRIRRGLHLGLAATWLLLGSILLSVGATRGGVAGFNAGITWWSYALKQCEAVILYLRLSAWPHPLNVFYGVDVVTNPAAVWWQLLLLIALVSGAFYALWRRPVIGFCAMWFFIILAPSSSVVPLVSQTVSEHRMYLSLAAPVVLFAAALFTCTGRHAWRIALCCIAAYAMISVRRNLDYRSDLAIWNDTVAKAPHNARARINFGAALNSAGDAAGARVQYEVALQLDPGSPEALNNIATFYLETGRPGDAIEPCRAAIRLRPGFSLAHSNLGSALVQTGQAELGISHLQTALRFNPDLAEAHCNLSSALLARGETEAAIAHGEQSVRLNPNLALGYFNLSNALLKNNDLHRATVALEAAVRVKPDYAEAHSNLGSLYYQRGDAARAVPHYEAALRLKPDFIDARNNLASALFQSGKPDQAVEQYRIVIRLQPAYAEAHFNLGLVLSRMGRNAEATAAYSEALRLRPGDERARSELARLKSLEPASAR
jgi:protein O-mannosyl-transferase